MKKKFLCLILVSVLLLSCSSCASMPHWNDFIADNNSVAIDLKSSAYFLTELYDEDVDVENSEEYDIFLLIEAKESRPEDLHIENMILDDDVDQALLQHRKKVKDYYVSYNKIVVEELGLSGYNYCVSFYSPCIEIVFDDADEYINCEKDLLDTLQSNQNLISSASNCIIYKQPIEEASFNNSAYSTTYSLDTAFDDIGVSNSQFTGQGIKVGVIESGIPQSTVNLKEGHYTFLHTNVTKHAWVVSSIIGGTTGIAKDVCFYFASSSGFVNNSNILIDTYGVNIINMSFGFLDYGDYTNKDACLDTIVSNTGCTIVKSAGNRSNEDSDPYYITSPGCSMNAITVGATDYNQNLSAFSSWLVSETFLLKPDVVAPGGILWDIPNIPNGNEGHSGTSCSAPMVVGTIALLMEEFPELKVNPALVKSVVHLGAKKLPTQTSYFDEYSGFGLINYQKMRNCLLSVNYSNFTISTTADAGTIVLSKNITIPYWDSIAVNANSIVNSSITTSSSASATPTYTDYTIKIYDVRASTYVASSSIDSSVDYLLFTNNNANNTSFRIDIVLGEDSNSSETEIGSVAYELIPHSHSYSYKWMSDTLHKRNCRYCDDCTTSSHVVTQGSNTTDGYGICLLCRGRVFMGVLLSIPDGLAHTDNGSYILTNGIIVLVEEDVEAYMAGTLEFYYGEKE